MAIFGFFLALSLGLYLVAAGFVMCLFDGKFTGKFEWVSVLFFLVGCMLLWAAIYNSPFKIILVK